MRKLIGIMVGILLGILLISLVGATYIAPDILNVTLILKGSYVSPSITNVTLILDEAVAAPPVDTCSCPAINSNWNMKWSDNCTVNSFCNIGTGIFHLYGPGAGTLTLNAQVMCSGKEIEFTTPKSYLINETNLEVI